LRLLFSVFFNHVQRRPRAGWRLLVQFILFVLLFIAVMIPTTLASERYGFIDESTLFLTGIVQCLVMILSVVLAGFLLDRRQPASFGFVRKVCVDRWWMLDLLLGFGLGAIAMLWIFGVEVLLGWINIERVGLADELTLAMLLKHQAAFLTLMILVGISEEMFSRGYQLKNLSEGFRRLGNWPAVMLATFVTSAIFGLLHAGNDNATWTSNVGVALAGVMLGTARITTGSLAAPIGLHISWNLFQGPILGFPVSGSNFQESLIGLVQRGDPMWTGGPFGPEAGLIGCIATIALTMSFIVWGLAKSQLNRGFAALTHFHRIRPLKRVMDEPMVATIVS
jgi:uncharacterized protein